MNGPHRNTHDELNDFETELRKCTPWTPAMIVLPPKTGYRKTPPGRLRASDWKTLSLGLLLGLVAGVMLVALFQKPVEPRTIEIVRYIENPPPVQEQPAQNTMPILPATDHWLPATNHWPLATRIPSYPLTADRELDALIGSYSDRAKTMARITKLPSSTRTNRFEMLELPNDPNSVFQLHESLKM